jgi:hypothetical protein
LDIAISTAAVNAADSGRREVRDVFRKRVLGADATSIDTGCFAGLGESVVARVKVLALFEVFG